MYRQSPNCVYVGDVTPRGERVIAVGTGRNAVVVLEDADGQAIAVSYQEVHR